MVGSDTLGTTARGVDRPGEASQALAAILSAGSLRYFIILSWACGLAGTIKPHYAVAWLVATLIAGYTRGLFEKRMAGKLEGGWGLIFPLVATLTTGVWASAPLLAWFSTAVFGHVLAIALIISGYTLVFAQLRNAPRQAAIVSSPYGVAALIILMNLWGQPGFGSFIAIVPFVAASLFVMVMMAMLRENRIRAFQEHQAHLIAELEEARDKADAASEAKSSFLGVISHELRTPMNGVLGAAQLLDVTRLEPTQREYLSIIRNSGDNLLSLLNDILDMTKIEAGKMTFDTVEVNIQDLHKRVMGPFSAQTEAKGLTLDCRFEGDVPASVIGDPLRVCQVLNNLLSNAVKFTDTGGIDYVTRGKRLSEKRVAFEFSITDTGAGISEDDLNKLFQPFTQVDASSTRRFGGTGLGLTICRRMANIMGGDITVKSTVGKGSTFTFCVEADVVQWAPVIIEDVIPQAAQDCRGMNVLVVEDHPVNRMILETWLTAQGHTVTLAENGKIATDIAAGQRFELIVMDVNMPVMDGLTATRHIRDTGENTNTPVAFLSASARSEDHQAGLESGADAYLNKPVEFDCLAAILAQASEGRTAVREANLSIDQRIQAAA